MKQTCVILKLGGMDICIYFVLHMLCVVYTHVVYI